MASNPLNSKTQARFSIADVISDKTADEIGERLKQLDQTIRNDNPGTNEVRFSISEGDLCASWEAARREPQPYDPEAYRAKISRRQDAIRRKAMRRFIEARRVVNKLDWKPSEEPAELRALINQSREETDAS